MSSYSQPRRENEEYGDQILSKAVKAGRRTYFFDVRATRADDYFLTITESRKMTASDGSVSYDRHKIFLYKEDFTKFADGLRADQRPRRTRTRTGGRRVKPSEYRFSPGVPRLVA